MNFKDTIFWKVFSAVLGFYAAIAILAIVVLLFLSIFGVFNP